MCRTILQRKASRVTLQTEQLPNVKLKPQPVTTSIEQIPYDASTPEIQSIEQADAFSSRASCKTAQCRRIEVDNLSSRFDAMESSARFLH